MKVKGKFFVVGKVNGLINLLTVNQHRLIRFCAIQKKIVVFIIHCLEYDSDRPE